MASTTDIKTFITLLSSPLPSLSPTATDGRSIDEYLPSPSPTPQRPRSTKTRRGARGSGKQKRSRSSSSASPSPTQKAKLHKTHTQTQTQTKARPAGSVGVNGGKKMGSWTKDEVRQLWDALGLLPVKVKWDEVAAKVEGRDKTWRYDMMPKLQAYIDSLGE
ncbi:hypothetical protein IAU59_000909 [Kwoniella sp. CBS 9459]